MQQCRLEANGIESGLAKKGLRGDHGKHVEYSSAEWPCNMEGQLHTGLYYQKCNQPEEGRDSFPLFSTCEAVSGIMCTVLGSLF